MGTERELVGAKSVLVLGSEAERRDDDVSLLERLDLDLAVSEASSPAAAREILEDHPVDALVVAVDEVRGDAGALVMLRGAFAGRAASHAKRMLVAVVIPPPSRKDVVALVGTAGVIGIKNFKLLIRPLAPDTMCALLVDNLGRSAGTDRAGSSGKKRSAAGPREENFDWVIERLKKGSLALPGAPSTVIKIREMVRAGETNPELLGTAVEGDVAVLTMVIRLAGSVAYRGVNEINGARDAVVRIGAQQVGRLAEVSLARTAFFSQLGHLNDVIQSAWKHTIARAEIMRSTARHEGEKMQERRYLQGILADVGAPLLVNSIAQVDQGFTVNNHSRAFMEEHHEQVGGFLLSTWGVPNDCVELACLHHLQSEATPVAKRLLLACRVATSLGYPSPFEEHEPLEPAEAANDLLLTSEEDLQALTTAIEDQLGATGG